MRRVFIFIKIFLLHYHLLFDGFNHFLMKIPKQIISAFCLSLLLFIGQLAFAGNNLKTNKAPMAAAIILGEIDISNRYIDITFDEGVWSNPSTTTPLIPGDFNLNFSVNGGNLNAVSIKSVKQTDSPDESLASALVGGELSVRLFLNLDGTPLGDETVNVTPSSDVTIYISGGTPITTAESTGTLYFNQAPEITNTTTQTQICSNTAFTFNLTSNLSGTSYTWTASSPTPSTISGFSTSGSGATISETLINSGTITGEVRYVVTPENSGVMGNTVTFVAKVYPVPNLTIDPTSQTICNNDVALIEFDGDVLNTTYAWIATPDANIDNANNGASDSRILQVLENTGTTSAQVTYEITPSANSCDGTPQTATVTVLPTYYARITSSKDTICNETSNDSFEVELEGSGPWNIEYTDGSATYNETANASPYTVSVSPGNSNTTYEIISAEDQSSGCMLTIDSDKDAFTVYRLKEISAVFTSTADVICESATTYDLEVQFTGLGPWDLEYLENGATLNEVFTKANSVISVSPTLGTNTYELVSVTDQHPRAVACATTASGTVDIEKIAYPTATISFEGGSTSKEVCLNDDVVLEVNFTGNGPWDFTYNNGLENITINDIDESTYTFTENITRSGTIVFSLVSVTTTTPTCSGIVSGNATAEVIPVPSGIATVSGNNEVCYNASSVQFTATNILNADEYIWTVPKGVVPVSGSLTTSSSTIELDFSQGAESGLIQVQGSNLCGTGTLSSGLSLDIIDSPAITDAITGSEIVCAGSTGIVYSVPDQGDDVSYIWSLPNGATSGGVSGETRTTNNEITVNYSTSASSSTIEVAGSNECLDRSESISKDITVRQVPAQPTSLTGPESFCAESTDLEFTADDIPDIDEYAWEIPDSFTAQDGTLDESTDLYFTSGPTITVTAGSNTGLMSIKAAGINDCGVGDLSNALNLDVNALPSFYIESTLDEAYVGQTIYFNAVSKEEIESWSWQFGDGASATGETSEHSYKQSGLYSVQLEGTNTESCTGSYLIDVFIENGLPVAIMNIITPNNDGKNDGLYIEGIETFPSNEVKLINRLGVEVFSTEDYLNNWDDYNISLQPGSYICLFKIKSLDKTISQTITVIQD